MNQSQLVLKELSDNPERAIVFLKNINTLIGLRKREWSRITISYLLGFFSGLFMVWLIK